MKCFLLILENDLKRETMILLKKTLLCIYSRVLCLSLAKISKIWFSVLLEIAVVN